MASSKNDEFRHIQVVFDEFRAGKMSMDGTLVVPDNRKGLFRMGKGEDGLHHIQWLDRTLNVIESDHIIFPGEAVFEKVNQSSGRTYILKFLADDRKFFFWMQEPRADNDSELCNMVNSFLNKPLGGDAKDMDEDAIVSRALNMFSRNMGAEATSDVTSAGPVRVTNLQPIPRKIMSLGVVQSGDPDADLGLGEILKPDFVFPLVRGQRLHQQLAPYLPKGRWTPAKLRELFESPPFLQQLDSFTCNLRNGQVDLTQFGVDPSKIPENVTVSSFLEALEDSVARTSEGSAKGGTDSKSQARDGSDSKGQ